MDEVVTAGEANRQFSRILQRVRDGRSVVVTSHGRPVARIVPAEGETATRRAARDALLARLEAQPAVPADRWSREDLYARER